MSPPGWASETPGPALTPPSWALLEHPVLRLGRQILAHVRMLGGQSEGPAREGGGQGGLPEGGSRAERGGSRGGRAPSTLSPSPPPRTSTRTRGRCCPSSTGCTACSRAARTSVWWS